MNGTLIFEANVSKVTNLIIDDNWQSLVSRSSSVVERAQLLQDNGNQPQVRRGMNDFEANKEGFPQGLRHCVSAIRRRHPNIQHIGVWHALVRVLATRSNG